MQHKTIRSTCKLSLPSVNMNLIHSADEDNMDLDIVAVIPKVNPKLQATPEAQYQIDFVFRDNNVMYVDDDESSVLKKVNFLLFMISITCLFK